MRSWSSCRASQNESEIEEDYPGDAPPGGSRRGRRPLQRRAGSTGQRGWRFAGGRGMSMAPERWRAVRTAEASTFCSASTVVARQRLPLGRSGDGSKTGRRERALYADQRSRRPVLRLHQQECGPEHGRGDGRPGTRSGQRSRAPSATRARLRAALRRKK